MHRHGALGGVPDQPHDDRQAAGVEERHVGGVDQDDGEVRVVQVRPQRGGVRLPHLQVDGAVQDDAQRAAVALHDEAPGALDAGCVLTVGEPDHGGSLHAQRAVGDRDPPVPRAGPTGGVGGGVHPGDVPTAPPLVPADPAATGDLHAVLPVPPDVDVARTVGRLRRGPGDPTWSRSPDGSVWHAVRRPAGTATVRLRRAGGGDVRADAWGAGARQALADVPGLLGLMDDCRGFPDHLHPAVARARRAHAGVRLARSGDVWETVVTAVLEQRVVAADAKASWRRLVATHGTPAPGPVPAGLRVAPPPADWVAMPVWEWRRAGVDAQRSDTVRRAAQVAHAFTAALTPDELGRRLLTVRGIGPWTVAEVTSRALGDADAVSVGDAHLPHLVGWALTGRRADDAGMLRLLEPWRGHRQRVLVLLELAYRARMPAYGPRAPRAAPLR